MNDTGMIRLTCSVCHARLRLPSHLASKRIRCPKCRNRVDAAPATVLEVVEAVPARAWWPWVAGGALTLVFLVGLGIGALAVILKHVSARPSPSAPFVAAGTDAGRPSEAPGGAASAPTGGRGGGLGMPGMGAAGAQPDLPDEPVAGVGRFADHPDPIGALALSPHGRLAVSACGGATYVVYGKECDLRIRLWDVAQNRLVRYLVGHTDTVNGLAFSPDSRRVLSASNDGTVRLWDAETGQELKRFGGHGGFVTSVAYSPDGRRALSGGDDATLRLWDLDQGTEQRRFQGHEGIVSGVAFAPDGRRALSAGHDGTVRLWEVATGKPIRSLTGHTGRVLCVTVSPDGRRAASGGEDATIRLWDVGDGREVRVLKGHTDPVTCVAFSPDGRRLLSASGAVYFTDEPGDGTKPPVPDRFGLTLTSTGDRSSSSPLSRPHVRVVSRKGTVLAGAFRDGKIYLYCLRTGGVTLEGITGNADWDGSDSTVRLWDAASGQEVYRFQGHTRRVACVVFSPDGRCAYSAGNDRTVRAWGLPRPGISPASGFPPAAMAPPRAGRGSGAPRGSPDPAAPPPHTEPSAPPIEVDDPGISACIVARHQNGVTIYGGHVAFEITEGQANARTILDKPGSLWFIAEGGAKWGTAELTEGKIYQVSADRRPVVTGNGEYSYQVTFDHDRPVYRDRAREGAPVGTIRKGERVQVLLPGSEAKGWHKVRTTGQVPVEGWVQGAFAKSRFLRHPGSPGPGGMSP